MSFKQRLCQEPGRLPASLHHGSASVTPLSAARKSLFLLAPLEKGEEARSPSNFLEFQQHSAAPGPPSSCQGDIYSGAGTGTRAQVRTVSCKVTGDRTRGALAAEAGRRALASGLLLPGQRKEQLLQRTKLITSAGKIHSRLLAGVVAVLLNSLWRQNPAAWEGDQGQETQRGERSGGVPLDRQGRHRGHHSRRAGGTLRGEEGSSAWREAL